MSEKSTRVYIGGDEYSIKADVDIETTKKVAEYVDSKINSMKGNVPSRDKVKIAVLSALNIAGELFEFKNLYDNKKRKLDIVCEKIDSLIKKLD